MSIGTFISSSIQLHKEGQYDVALSLVCSSVDATSAKILPNEKLNNIRYKTFLKQNMRIITTFGMPGITAGGIRIKCINVPHIKTDDQGMVGLEDIIYHIIRCGLIHQCEIEDRIEFTEATHLGDFEGKFRIPNSIIFGLVMAVILTKENKNERLASSHKIQINGQSVDLDCLWGKEEFEF